MALADLLRTFWTSHDPTQGMGQGNDMGTQYRSAIYPTTQKQLELAEASATAYGAALAAAGRSGEITTEIKMSENGEPVKFYYAEDYHQQVRALHCVCACVCASHSLSVCACMCACVRVSPWCERRRGGAGARLQCAVDIATHSGLSL